MDTIRAARATGGSRAGRHGLLLGALGLLLAPPLQPAGLVTPAAAQEVQQIEGGPLRYRVLASSPRLNRRLLGPVTRTVHGVPAEPVDSFVWDGEGSTPVEGSVMIDVDPVTEIGFIQARWRDVNGAWRYTQTRFIHPEHSSGVRVGTSVQQTEHFVNEGVTAGVYLHGDTGAGMPVLPTVFAHLATWGPADVMRNGRPFENPFELPAPQWLGHVMVTEGVRGPDGAVRAVTGEPYDMSRAAEGRVDPDDLEVHVVFHDERFPLTESVPPLFSFFYHLVFEDVSIQLVESGEPIVVDLSPHPEELRPLRPEWPERGRSPGPGNLP